jgi:hypothetical protein
MVERVVVSCSVWGVRVEGFRRGSVPQSLEVGPSSSRSTRVNGAPELRAYSRSECEVFEMKVERVVLCWNEPLGKPGSEARAAVGNVILARRACFFLAASHVDKRPIPRR